MLYTPYAQEGRENMRIVRQDMGDLNGTSGDEKYSV